MIGKDSFQSAILLLNPDDNWSGLHRAETLAMPVGDVTTWASESDGNWAEPIENTAPNITNETTTTPTPLTVLARLSSSPSQTNILTILNPGSQAAKAVRLAFAADPLIKSDRIRNQTDGEARLPKIGA